MICHHLPHPLDRTVLQKGRRFNIRGIVLNRDVTLSHFFLIIKDEDEENLHFFIK